MPAQLLTAQKIKDLVTGRYIGNISRHESRDYLAAFTIQDFVVFSYDKDGSLINLNVISKPYTKITVYSPLSSVSGLRLAKMVQSYGFFDYAFTTKSPTTKEPYIVSSHFLKKNPYIGITSINWDKVSETRKIMMDKKTIKGGGVGVMPGNNGKFGVYIYSKKEKKVIIYLEDSGIK